MRVAAAVDRAEIHAAGRAYVADLAPSLALLAAVLVAAGWVQVAVGLRPLDAVRRRLADVRSGRRAAWNGVPRRGPPARRRGRPPARGAGNGDRAGAGARGRSRAQPEVSPDRARRRRGRAPCRRGRTHRRRDRRPHRGHAPLRGARAGAGARRHSRAGRGRAAGAAEHRSGRRGPGRTPREGRSTGRSTSPTASALPSTRRTSSRSSATSPRTPPNGPPPRCASAVGATAPPSCSRSRTTGRAF